MTSKLMRARRFAPLFWCQFLSAFNDNLLKNALVVLIAFSIGGPQADALVALAGVAFIAPFFLLSGLGGQLADRCDKAVVARGLKLAEVGAAAVAALGFALASPAILFAALFLFGVVAALFGPIKYGILPDHLPAAELPAGNALIEGATFLAILLGTAVGAVTVRAGADLSGVAALVGVVAAACWAISLKIPATGAGAPDLVIDANPFRSTRALLVDLVASPRLWWGGVVLSWSLGGRRCRACTAAGAGQGRARRRRERDRRLSRGLRGRGRAGSGTASFLARGRIVLLPVVVGAALMGAFALDFALAAHGEAAAGTGTVAIMSAGRGLRAAIDLAGIGFGGGLFVVPCFAAVQAWSEPARRARTVAAVNVLNAAAMVAGGLAAALLRQAGLGVAPILALLGLARLAAAVAIGRTMPAGALRDLLSMLFRAFYRLEVRGLDNLAKAGPNAIVALNHVSFLDGALALSLLDRDPVFAIDHTIARRWWVRPFLRITRALPLDPLRPLASRTLINAVKGGETLVIFPEGRLTVTGGVMKVYDGAGMIADRADAPIVPVRIDGLERTAFSRLTRAQMRRHWFPKVTVTVLEPVRLALDPALRGKARRKAAGEALYEIVCDLVFRTTPTDCTILDAVIAASRRNGSGRIALEDAVSGALSYRRLLAGAAVLARKLAPLAPEGGAVGVMLPTANGAAATVLGLISAGRVPAMINFTAGAANVRAACRAASVTTIVTARGFVAKAQLEDLVAALAPDIAVVHLEDVRAGIGARERRRAACLRRAALVARRPDDPAAILFTSGSEGAPKGVVLSHRNILANAAQAAARIDFGRADTVFNAMPVFHSFGLTAGLVLPLVAGVRAYLYPSPLHYRTVPELVYGTNATILFGTDTFLAGYARAAHAYDFRSLRYVVAGAEPVKEATRRVYMEKFGLRVLEGYGVTEAAPVLALNTPMFSRSGTVGRFLPGIAARIEPVPGIAGAGRLHVKGPNVMLGYLRAERPGTLEAPPDGWHDTGDIVAIDGDGFVAIKGRAKRFAKIGGEMISLAAVEALAAALWPDALSAAVAVADARKGEKLVLVTAAAGARRADFLAFAQARAASELMVPADIMVVDAVPVLGSGKVDHAAVARLVDAAIAARHRAA